MAAPLRPPVRVAPTTRNPLPMGRREKRDVLAQCECGCLATATVRGSHLVSFTLPAHWAEGELIHDECGLVFRLYDNKEKV